MGVFRLDFEGRAVENFSPTLNISKTGRAIFPKFSGIAGLTGPYLRFGPEIRGGSNFEGSGGKVTKNVISDCGRVAFGGSLSNGVTRISNIFAWNFLQDHVATRIVHNGNLELADKNVGQFKKIQKKLLIIERSISPEILRRGKYTFTV